MTIKRVPAYRLVGKRGRRYVFAPLGDGTVAVYRYEGGKAVRREELGVEAARRRWTWLRSLGYTM